jgi:hypothetical protein
MAFRYGLGIGGIQSEIDGTVRPAGPVSRPSLGPAGLPSPSVVISQFSAYNECHMSVTMRAADNPFVVTSGFAGVAFFPYW